MTSKKYILSVLATAAIAFIFDFIWHGILLKDLYSQTETLWRGEDEISKYVSLNILFYLGIAAVAVSIYKCFILTGSKELLLKNSLKAGLLIGLLSGIMISGFYVYMPVPKILAFSWLVGNIIPFVWIGYVLYLINRNAGNKKK